MTNLIRVATIELARFLEANLPKLSTSWWQKNVVNRLSDQQQRMIKQRRWGRLQQLDYAALLRVLYENWFDLKKLLRLPDDGRNWVKELQTVRNKRAHPSAEAVPVSGDDFRDADTIERLLMMIGAEQASLDLAASVKATAIAAIAGSGGDTGEGIHTVEHNDGLEKRVEDHLRRLKKIIRHEFKSEIPFVSLDGVLTSRIHEAGSSARGARFFAGQQLLRNETREGEAIKLLGDQFTANRGTLLLSQGGSGKSTTLEEFLLGRARDYKTGGSVCVFVRMGRNYETPASLQAFLAACPEQACLTERDILCLADTGRLELVFDGADECKPSRLRCVLTLLADYISSHSVPTPCKLPWVIASRYPVMDDRLAADTLMLSPMDEPTQLRFFAAYLEDTARAAALHASLRGRPGASAILASPICLYLLCAVVPENGKFDEVPGDMPALYRRVVDVLYDREGLGSKEDPAPGKGRGDLFRPDLRTNVRDALAGVAFGSYTTHAPAQRTDVITALEKTVLRAVEAVERIERWPLFGRNQEGLNFEYRHETIRQYLAAEHLLAHPANAGRLFSALGRLDSFLVNCIFTLEPARFAPRPANDADRQMLETCWSWDPVAVAAMFPGDDQALRALPLIHEPSLVVLQGLLEKFSLPKSLNDFILGSDHSSPWWLPIVQTLQGHAIEESYADRIAEEEWSVPPQSLLESLSRREIWDAAYTQVPRASRFDRLVQLILGEPEPWADLLRACVKGSRVWTERITTAESGSLVYLNEAARRIVGCTVGLLDNHACFSPMPSKLTYEREEDEEDFGRTPPDDIYPNPDQIPKEWTEQDGRWLAYMLINEGRMPFGYVLWFLNTHRWFQPSSGRSLSRRQWNLLWERWHVFDNDSRCRRYHETYPDLPPVPGVRPDPLALTVYAKASPNIAAATVRLGWLAPDAFAPDLRREWANSDSTFDETLALIAGGLVERNWIPYAERFAAWVRNAVQRGSSYYVDHIFRDWPGNSMPWKTVRRDEGEAFLSLCTLWGGPYCPLGLNSSGGPVPWNYVAREVRAHFTQFCLRGLEWARDNPGSYNMAVHGGGKPGFGAVVCAILAVAGSDDLPWSTCLPEEWSLVCAPKSERFVRRCLAEGIVSRETLRAALDHWPTCPHVEAILNESEDLFDEPFRRSLMQEFDLDVLDINRPLGGGLSGSRVFRVYCRWRGEGDEVRLGVLKQSPDHEECGREGAGHDRALNSWLWADRGWVPERPHCATQGQYAYLLSRLAFPPTAISGVGPPTLHERIQDKHGHFKHDVTARLVSGIGRGYAERLELLFHGQTAQPTTTRREHLMRLLAHWPKLNRGLFDGTDGATLGLPTPNVVGIRDGDHVCLNPTWIAQQNCLVNHDRLRLPIDFQHGDLNAQNILVRADADANPADLPVLQMIDYEKVTNNLLALDLCWLAFWMLIASERDAPLQFDRWNLVPEKFIDAIFQDQPTGDLGDFQLGLNLIHSLFQPFRAYPVGGASETRGMTVNQLLSLTLAGAALAKSAYEIRDIHKRLAQNDDPSGETIRRKRAWAVTFYRISARAFERLFDTPPFVPPGAPIADIRGALHDAVGG